MYEKPKKSLAELTERKRELTNKIVNGQNLDYMAMEKLQKQMAAVIKEINQRKEELKDTQLTDLHRKGVSNG